MCVRLLGTRLLLAAAVTLGALQGTADAQSTYGGVVGVLTDPTKAVVARRDRHPDGGADQRGAHRHPGPRGSYEFLNLVQGRYQVDGRDERASARRPSAVRGGGARDRAHRPRAEAAALRPKR